jgi:hypothetical protein
MIYNGPGFLKVVKFGSTPSPFPALFRQKVFSLSFFLFVAGRASGGERAGHIISRKPGPL